MSESVLYVVLLVLAGLVAFSVFMSFWNSHQYVKAFMIALEQQGEKLESENIVLARELERTNSMLANLKIRQGQAEAPPLPNGPPPIRMGSENKTINPREMARKP